LDEEGSKDEFALGRVDVHNATYADDAVVVEVCEDVEKFSDFVIF
jgi:hypothetical protein